MTFIHQNLKLVKLKSGINRSQAHYLFRFKLDKFENLLFICIVLFFQKKDFVSKKMAD